MSRTLRRHLARALIVLWLASAGRGAEVPAARFAGPDARLAEVRRLLREEGSASVSAADLAAPLAAGSDLWAVRLRVVRAVLGSPEPPPAIEGGTDLETARLGLPGLGSWVGLMRSHPGTLALLSWAAGEPFEPLARDAVTHASREARTVAEKRAVREALASCEARAPSGPRASIALALAKARVAATPVEARRIRLELLAAWPDAPERAADLFDATDLTEFNAEVRTASDGIRAARALSLARRSPREAARLLPRCPATSAARLDAAETRLLLGDTRDALRLLRTEPAPTGEGALLRAKALELSAEMRGLLRQAEKPAGTRRAAKRRKRPVTTSPRPPKPLGREASLQAAGLRSRAAALLTRPLSDADRRRLLANTAHLALRSGESIEARRLVGDLVVIDPSSTVLSEAFFREAFEAFRAGRFDEAALSFREQSTLYRDVDVRRRATYWEGRAREKAGEGAAARLLFASLVSGTTPDVYALWAATLLGVPTAEGPTAEPVGGGLAGLDTTVPASPSRELLACGLPGLAEDAAEAEGTADGPFLAALASERGDHRRTAALLKQRWPELGSPEEGDVPIPVRRLFYPRSRAALLEEIAATASVPPALVFGLVRQESVFTPNVRSRAGAVGLMQVMPATGRQLERHGRRSPRPDLLDPAVNARLGVAYLRRLLDSFEGDSVLALAAYNAGPSRVRRWRADLASLPADEFLESIPVAESRHYIRRILFFEGAYASLYGLPSSASPPPTPRSAPAP
ncbi:MAG: transglycosylase SLT domain-containing protein [Acidithiobacillales bacterium]